MNLRHFASIELQSMRTPLRSELAEHLGLMSRSSNIETQQSHWTSTTIHAFVQVFDAKTPDHSSMAVPSKDRTGVWLPPMKQQFA
jgi:hypothetical protein